MAALTRPTEATYEVHENVTVDTYGKLVFFSSKVCSEEFCCCCLLLLLLLKPRIRQQKMISTRVRFLSYLYWDTKCGTQDQTKQDVAVVSKSVLAM